MNGWNARSACPTDRPTDLVLLVLVQVLVTGRGKGQGEEPEERARAGQAHLPPHLQRQPPHARVLIGAQEARQGRARQAPRVHAGVHLRTSLACDIHLALRRGGVGWDGGWDDEVDGEAAVAGCRRLLGWLAGWLADAGCSRRPLAL